MTAPAFSDFEQLVQQIIAATSCSREKAIETARLNRPDLDRPAQLQLERAENLREKDEQAYIVKLFRGFGCKVYNLSQARATKQTPGLPDLWVTHKARGIAFWFEVKRSVGGRISDAQREFREACESSSVRHYIGDRRTAAKVLVDIGLARVGDGPCGIVPFHEGR